MPPSSRPRLYAWTGGWLLERATHRSKRQIEELIAEIAPRPDAPVVVRKLPGSRTLPMTGLLVAPNRGNGLGQGLAQSPMLELRPDGVGAPDEGRAGPSGVALRRTAPIPWSLQDSV